MALLVPPPLKKAAARSKRKIQGIAFLGVFVLLFLVTVAFYNKAFERDVPVTLRAERAGNLLYPRADVKFRGVNVGTVKSVTTRGGVVTVKLAIFKNEAGKIPSNSTARILPKTLFGPRYVELMSPQLGVPANPVHDGTIISQDNTQVGIEVEMLYDNLLPFLRTVQPEKLNATLSAIATALAGRGNELGDNLSRLDDYLRNINPHLPSITQDIDLLANFADNLNAAVPDLMRFLDATVTTARTIVEKQDTLSALFTGTSAFADTANGVLNENRSRLIQLPETSVPIVSTVANRADELPPTLNGLTELSPLIQKTFGSGPNKNWLHIKLTVVGNKGPYIGPQDCPKNISPVGNMYGPNCGNVRVQSTNSPASDTTSNSAGGATSMPAGLDAASLLQLNDIASPSVGSVGSPQEKQIIDSIVGSVTAAQAQTHDYSLDAADLLLGPMLRGTEVAFQ